MSEHLCKKENENKYCYFISYQGRFFDDISCSGTEVVYCHKKIKSLDVIVKIQDYLKKEIGLSNITIINWKRLKESEVWESES